MLLTMLGNSTLEHPLKHLLLFQPDELLHSFIPCLLT